MSHHSLGENWDQARWDAEWSCAHEGCSTMTEEPGDAFCAEHEAEWRDVNGLRDDGVCGVYR